MIFTLMIMLIVIVAFIFLVMMVGSIVADTHKKMLKNIREDERIRVKNHLKSL